MLKTHLLKNNYVINLVHYTLQMFYKNAGYEIFKGFNANHNVCQNMVRQVRYKYEFQHIIIFSFRQGSLYNTKHSH